nr:Myc-type, basic helix-loop-helix (bHLH) domain-containing protein [Tanacetum cinerariifolium]
MVNLHDHVTMERNLNLAGSNKRKWGRNHSPYMANPCIIVHGVENKDEHMQRKLVHKEIKRERKKNITKLYASLGTLLPTEFIKGKCSISDRTYLVVNYIKHMQEKIEALSVKRDQLNKLVGMSVKGNVMNNVSINSCNGRTVEIQISSYSIEDRFHLSEILKALVEEGLHIINYTFTKINKRNQKGKNLDEDNLRQMQNNFLKKYFEFLDNKDTGMEEDLIRIKSNIYSTKVQTINEYVAFLNLIKKDEIVSQQWDIFRNKFDKVVKWFYNYYLEKSLPGPIPPTINEVHIHLFDLYKLVEGLEGYLSVYFGQEFGIIGEILGLSKGNGENLKKCYIKYLDVFTSYYKTARVPQQEYESILKNPTRKLEEDKDKKCLMSHQWDFGETCAPTANTAVQKGKEELEHFGVKLEDEEEAKNIQLQPIQAYYERKQNLQGSIIGPSTTRKSHNEDTSDDLTIII